jgi:hypothetical protein
MASVVISSDATEAAFCRAEHDLGRVDDAGLEEVFELVGLSVVAVTAFAFTHALNDDVQRLSRDHGARHRFGMQPPDGVS